MGSCCTAAMLLNIRDRSIYWPKLNEDTKIMLTFHHSYKWYQKQRLLPLLQKCYILNNKRISAEISESTHYQSTVTRTVRSKQKFCLKAIKIHNIIPQKLQCHSFLSLILDVKHQTQAFINNIQALQSNAMWYNSPVPSKIELHTNNSLQFLLNKREL